MSVKYQGWTNYETWSVNLWLSNDEGTHRDVMRLARHALIDIDTGDSRAEARATLAEEIKQYVEDSLPDLGASLASDLLTAAIGEVDWDEIADSYLCSAEEDGAA